MNAPDRKARRETWERLARQSPELATDGYNACRDHPAAEPLGTWDWVQDYLALKPGERLLDVGCGWGKLTVPAAMHGAAVVGVDLSPTMLSTARMHASQRGATVHLARSEGACLPFQDAAFDVVWCHAVIMHLPEAEARALVDEIARVLAPGARAFLHFPNRYHPMSIASRAAAAWLGASPARAIRRRSYTVDEAVGLLARGLEVVRVWSESMQVVPPAIPARIAKCLDDVATGVPSEDRLVAVLPRPVSDGLTSLYARLRLLANTGRPELVRLSKDFVVEVRKRGSPEARNP